MNGQDGLDTSMKTNVGLDKVMHLALTDIYEFNQQPRSEIDEQKILDLAESIALVGVINPITVVWNPEDEKWVIRHGEIRYFASLHLGLKTIPAIKKSDDSPEITFAAMVMDNTYRNELNDLELANAVVVLVSEKLGIAYTAVKAIFRRLDYKPESISEQENTAVDFACKAVRLTAGNIRRNFLPLLGLPKPCQFLIRFKVLHTAYVRVIAQVQNNDFQQRFEALVSQPINGESMNVIREESLKFYEEALKLLEQENPKPTQAPEVRKVYKIVSDFKKNFSKLSPEKISEITLLMNQMENILSQE